MAGDEKLILVAHAGAPVGLKGEIRLTVFAEEPERLLGYRELVTGDSRALRVTGMRRSGKSAVARFAGVGDRGAAEGLRGADLFVARSRLADDLDEDEFYQADLIGLEAVDGEGRPVGTIVSISNYGAGDLLEVMPPDDSGETESFLVVFDRTNVPRIDLAGGVVVVNRPAETGKESE